MAGRESQPKLPTVQEWMWEEAGIDKARMGALIRKAVQKTEEQLEASTEKAFCTNRDGKIVYAKAQADHQIQANAAERIHKYMLPRITSEGRRIEIVNPDWAYGEASVEEIEAEKIQALEAPKENAYNTEGTMEVWEKERQP